MSRHSIVGAVLATICLSLAIGPPANASPPQWETQNTPNPGGNYGALAGIACPSPTTCIAVGHYTNTENEVLPLAEARRDGRWTILPIPLPAGAASGGLLDVTCVSASACTAVGSYQAASTFDTSAVLVEFWDGTRWTVQPAPNPTAATYSELYRVACPSPTICVAVGDYVNTNKDAQPLIEVWKGSRWTVEKVPFPDGAFDAALTGVACSAPTACIAVGNHDFGRGTLVEVWHGSRWTIQHSPNPGNGGYSTFWAVACPSSTYCSAVGSYFNSASGDTVPLVEAWDGVHWAFQPAPHRAQAYESQLYDVACTSPTACTAVGYNHHGLNTSGIPLVEAWNGSRWWTIQSTTRPVGSIASELFGVACLSQSMCTAVGDFAQRDNDQLPLVESRSG